MTERLNLIPELLLPDEKAARAARARWDAIAKPLGSLGLLEDTIVQIAALIGSAEVRLDRRALLVFCADNGVVAQGVTQCGSEVTASAARALADGRSTANLMARRANCAVIPVDVGIRDFAPYPGVLDRRVQNGTADMTQGPAMTRDACLAAMRAGVSLAEQQAQEGVQLLALGEMGIGNTTTASAAASVLLDLPPERLTGRGAGLSDAGLQRKLAAIRTAIERSAPDPRDPVDVLAKVGGLDLAAMCGAYLGAAKRRVPVLIDGVISASAALCAARLCPAAAHAMLASHVSSEPACSLLLDALDRRALISAELHLGEGTGALAAMPLLDLALEVYRNGETFSQRRMEPYTKQS